MAFEIISFLAGVAAGIITGGLAGLLHGLERTADLQEKVRLLSKEVERVSRRQGSSNSKSNADIRPDVDRLQKELDEIHAEIRKMYRRSER
jgi:archaellum component FlaC